MAIDAHTTTLTPGTIRHALDVLGRLSPGALALIAQLAIDRLDAGEDADSEPDDEAGCEVEDFPAYDAGPGDADDAEEADDHGRDDPDDPAFPSRAFGRPPAVITRADRPVSLRSLGARR